MTIEITPMSIRLLSVGGNPTNEDTTPPDPPAGVSNNSVNSGGFTTSWTNGPESDLQEHRVYRSSVGPGSGFSVVATVSVPSASYAHTGLSSETQYWVYVTALDSSGNESVASSVVSSTTSAVGSDPYDLYLSDNKSRGTIPFAVNWPNEPDTSANGTVEVFNQSQLNAALADGTHIQIRGPGNGGAASYTVGNWGGNDRWFDMDADAVVTGTIVIGNYLTNLNHARIKITGGTLNGEILVDGVSDLLIDGLTQNGSSNEFGRAWEAVRIAIVNSTLSLTEYPVGIFNYGAGPYTDWIIAGNSLTSGTGGTSVPIRIQGVNRLTIVDNHTHETGNGYAFRIHDYADNVWIRNNMVSTTGGTNGQIVYSPNHTTDDGIRTLGSVWSYDNVHYVLNGGTGLQLFDYPRFDQAVIVGHRAYSTSYGSPTSFNPFSGYTTGPGWSQSDNQADAYTSTPSWPGAGVPLY